MIQYRWLLMDADNTLFDFDAAEDYSLTRTLIHFGVTPTPELKEQYHAINSILWQAHDQGKISQTELGPRRFQLLFRSVAFPGEPGDGKGWNDCFLHFLADCSALIPGAEALCHRLSHRYILSLTTNGVPQVQRQRMKNSPLARYFEDRIFVSGEMGCRKPEKEYFDAVLSALDVPSFQRSKVLVIGDSLSSDIRGAFNSRLDSVWLHHPNARPGVLKPTYEVESLVQLSRLLGADRYVTIPL